VYVSDASGTEDISESREADGGFFEGFSGGDFFGGFDIL
jgi:hypothetical protein